MPAVVFLATAATGIAAFVTAFAGTGSSEYRSMALIAASPAFGLLANAVLRD